MASVDGVEQLSCADSWTGSFISDSRYIICELDYVNVFHQLLEFLVDSEMERKKGCYHVRQSSP